MYIKHVFEYLYLKTFTRKYLSSQWQCNLSTPSTFRRFRFRRSFLSLQTVFDYTVETPVCGIQMIRYFHRYIPRLHRTEIICHVINQHRCSGRIFLLISESFLVKLISTLLSNAIDRALSKIKQMRFVIYQLARKYDK